MFSFKDWPLRRKIIAPTVVITFILAIALGFIVDKQQRDLAISQARRTSEALAEQIRADRTIYSSRVVAKLRSDGVDFQTGNMESLEQKKHIPLPASFVLLTSDVVNKSGFHQMDLVSHWNINARKKPHDAFEDEGLRQLEVHPNRLEETVQDSADGPVYKRLVADVATETACIECHNNNPASARHDFKLQDVMGGLVITIPLSEAFADAHRNALFTTLALVGVFVVLLFVISAIQVRYISTPLVRLEQAADKISMGELDSSIAHDGNDEVGRLAKAFERMRTSLQAAMKQLEGND